VQDQAEALTTKETGGEVEGALGHAILRFGTEDRGVSLLCRRECRSIEQMAVKVAVLDAEGKELLSLSGRRVSPLLRESSRLDRFCGHPTHSKWCQNLSAELVLPTIQECQFAGPAKAKRSARQSAPLRRNDAPLEALPTDDVLCELGGTSTCSRVASAVPSLIGEGRQGSDQVEVRQGSGLQQGPHREEKVRSLTDAAAEPAQSCTRQGLELRHRRRD
jgi:hypothetical protein